MPNTRFKYTALSLLSAMALLACFSSCKLERNQTPDDTLIMILDTTLRDVDPRFAVSSHDAKISRLIAPGLTTSDTQDLQSVPYLAEAISEIEPLQWRIRLKPGLRFSDGTPLTAGDVAFTYASVLDEATGSL